LQARTRDPPTSLTAGSNVWLRAGPGLDPSSQKPRWWSENLYSHLQFFPFLGRVRDVKSVTPSIEAPTKPVGPRFIYGKRPEIFPKFWPCVHSADSWVFVYKLHTLSGAEYHVAESTNPRLLRVGCLAYRVPATYMRRLHRRRHLRDYVIQRPLATQQTRWDASPSA
jgi:hypothetical protein